MSNPLQWKTMAAVAGGFLSAREVPATVISGFVGVTDAPLTVAGGLFEPRK